MCHFFPEDREMSELADDHPVGLGIPLLLIIPRHSLPCTQAFASMLCPEPDESIPHPYMMFL